MSSCIKYFVTGEECYGSWKTPEGCIDVADGEGSATKQNHPQDFEIFKISSEISRFHVRFQDYNKISRFHARFQDYNKISILQ